MNYMGTYYKSNPDTILPVKTKLKNNETYKVEVTAVSSGGWHNSLYLEVIDRTGVTIASGYMMIYNVNNYESSDFQVVLTIAQTHKDGYTTTVASNAEDNTTVDIGEKTYSFGFGKNTPSSTLSVTTETDSFTFRSSTGKNNTTAFVGEKQNADIGANYPDIDETITFTNTGGFVPAPTNYYSNYRTFLLMFGFGAILVGLIVTSTVMVKLRKKEEE